MHVYIFYLQDLKLVQAVEGVRANRGEMVIAKIPAKTIWVIWLASWNEYVPRFRARNCRLWRLASSLRGEYVTGCHCRLIWIPAFLFRGHFSSRLPIKLKIVWKYELIRCTGGKYMQTLTSTFFHFLDFVISYWKDKMIHAILVLVRASKPENVYL